MSRGNRAKHIELVVADDEVIDLCELNEVIKFMTELERTRKAEREYEQYLKPKEKFEKGE